MRHAVHLKSVWKFSPYLTENTVCPLQGLDRLMPFREIITVCCKDHTKHIYLLCVGKMHNLLY
jgi:hypothetical protein